MKILILNLVASVLLLSFSFSAFASPRQFAAAKVEHSWSILAPDTKKPRFDVSGLARYQNQFLVVSDRYAYQSIYKLEAVDSKTFQAREFLAPRRTQANKQERPHLDIEGIAKCGEHFYLVDEEHQMVMVVDKERRAKERVLDLRSIHRQKKTTFASETESAGLEGVACDEVNQILYVANERMFRMIYKINLKTFKVEDFFDVPAGLNSPRFENGIFLASGFADLHFADGYLYAYQRNNRSVLKIDPKSKNLVASLSLLFHESNFYETNEVFGMGEGLFVDRDKIFLALDNNGMQQKSSNKIDGLLLQFARPKGF